MIKNKRYIIGNWKSNKNQHEVSYWMNHFARLSHSNNLPLNRIEAIICPSFVHLPQVKQLIKKLKIPIKLGAQDVSPFDNGPFTGEVSALQLKEFVDYVIIGHSERRSNFHERDDLLTKKVDSACKYKLIPIYCISDEDTFIPRKVKFVAYEPVWAIGSGKSDTPENVDRVALKNQKENFKTIYGGSVTPENIRDFFLKSHICGVLPGKASLDPVKFWEMIINAASI